MSFHLDYTNSSTKSQIPNPPGYAPATARDVSSKTTPAAVAEQVAKSNQLRIRRAWDLAFAPAKSLPMQGMMLYFSGSGVQIFSLGMIFTLLTSPISALLGIFKAFEAFRPTPASKNGKDVEPPSYGPLILPMLAYVGSQGLVLALGLYKCSTMGILPTGSGDWLQFETRQENGHHLEYILSDRQEDQA